MLYKCDILLLENYRNVEHLYLSYRYCSRFYKGLVFFFCYFYLLFKICNILMLVYGRKKKDCYRKLRMEKVLSLFLQHLFRVEIV